MVSGLHEDNVCIGDRYKIGTTLLEVSQPRKPCERLSHNTKNENTREVISQSGWTGWYVRVIEEGEIHQGDELILQHRPYPEWTIRRFKHATFCSFKCGRIRRSLSHRGISASV